MSSSGSRPPGAAKVQVTRGQRYLIRKRANELARSSYQKYALMLEYQFSCGLVDEAGISEWMPLSKGGHEQRPEVPG
jgi:hypothetical protein